MIFTCLSKSQKSRSNLIFFVYFAIEKFTWCVLFYNRRFDKTRKKCHPYYYSKNKKYWRSRWHKTICANLYYSFSFYRSMKVCIHLNDCFYFDWNYWILRGIISFINQNNVSWRFHITTWHNLTIGSYQGLSWCMHWIKFFLLGRHKTILGNK